MWDGCEVGPRGRFVGVGRARTPGLRRLWWGVLQNNSTVSILDCWKKRFRPGYLSRTAIRTGPWLREWLVQGCQKDNLELTVLSQ